MAGVNEKTDSSPRKGCVLIVAERPEDSGIVSTRLKAEGYEIRAFHDLKGALDAARFAFLDMVVFCGVQDELATTEIVQAARANNKEVEIVHLEPGDSTNLEACLKSVLEAKLPRKKLHPFAGGLECILDGLFDAVIVVDSVSEKVVLANSAAAGLLGYREKEVNGRSLSRLVARGHIDEARGLLDRVSKAGNIETGTLVFRRKESDLLLCQFKATLAGRQAGGLVQIVLRSTGERQKLVEQLTEVGKALSLGQAISGIVHEINNPLAAILGYAQLALTATSRKKLDEYLQTIHQQAGRCQAIAQKLSSFARHREPLRKVADLNRIIGETVSLFEHELKANNIELELKLSSSPLGVHVDPTQMQQVFINLINNAREAMKEVAVGKISIASQRLGSDAVVRVADNGPGIPESVRKRIFQPFFSTKPNATGLGLSVSRSVLGANDGEIEAVEKVDVGAEFRIRLPLVGEAADQDPKTTGEPEHDFPSGKKILVIDDEKPIADLVRQILNRAGEKVDIALTPAQAYKKINGKDYDMILIDIKLPGGDGKEIFRRIKNVSPQAAEKVVFCTGDLIDDETRTFLSGLDNCVVEKPFSVNGIYAVARKVL